MPTNRDDNDPLHVVTGYTCRGNGRGYLRLRVRSVPATDAVVYAAESKQCVYYIIILLLLLLLRFCSRYILLLPSVGSSTSDGGMHDGHFVGICSAIDAHPYTVFIVLHTMPIAPEKFQRGYDTVCVLVGCPGGGRSGPPPRGLDAARVIFPVFAIPIRTRYNTSIIILLYTRDASRATARP